jgi:hypothetical protein
LGLISDRASKKLVVERDYIFTLNFADISPDPWRLSLKIDVRSYKLPHFVSAQSRQPERVELYDAEVCADGNCRPGDDVNTTWYKVDGPGAVDFGDKNVLKT